ncbi:hypothetical protein QOT17_005103 [Balamuthia mandrillaris]
MWRRTLGGPLKEEESTGPSFKGGVTTTRNNTSAWKVCKLPSWFFLSACALYILFYICLHLDKEGIGTCNRSPYVRESNPDATKEAWLSATLRHYLFFWAIRFVFLLLNIFLFIHSRFRAGLTASAIIIFVGYFGGVWLVEDLKHRTGDTECKKAMGEPNGISGHAFYSAWAVAMLFYHLILARRTLKSSALNLKPAQRHRIPENNWTKGKENYIALSNSMPSPSAALTLRKGFTLKEEKGEGEERRYNSIQNGEASPLAEWQKDAYWLERKKRSKRGTEQHHRQPLIEQELHEAGGIEEPGMEELTKLERFWELVCESDLHHIEEDEQEEKSRGLCIRSTKELLRKDRGLRLNRKLEASLLLLFLLCLGQQLLTTYRYGYHSIQQLFLGGFCGLLFCSLLVLLCETVFWVERRWALWEHYVRLLQQQQHVASSTTMFWKVGERLRVREVEMRRVMRQSSKTASRWMQRMKQSVMEEVRRRRQQEANTTPTKAL